MDLFASDFKGSVYLRTSSMIISGFVWIIPLNQISFLPCSLSQLPMIQMTVDFPTPGGPQM